MMTPQGKSRQFGFVGYRSEEEAVAAQRYFNGSFIDTSRIKVELAKPFGDSDIPRPWSKHSKAAAAALDAAIEQAKAEKDARQKKKEELMEKKKKHLEAIGISTDDPKLAEFVDIMKPRGQLKTWQNDDIVANSDSRVEKPKNNGISAIPSVIAKNSDDELYEDLPAMKTESEPDLSKTDDDGDEEEQPLEIIERAHLDKNDRGHKSSNTQLEIEKDEEETPDRTKLITEILMDTGRIFVRNLSFACEEDDLRGLFGKYGPVSEIHIPLDRENKKPKGIAYVTFMIPEHAVTAYAELDGRIFQGRLLHLIPSREKRVIENIPDSDFKKKKADKMKSQMNDERTWNSLFMSADAVAESMANKLNVTKSDILDVEADSMAVRMALAETHIIEETKKYLESEGVFIDAFKNNMRKERSETILMVKNIPYQTDMSELRELFMRYGDIVRLVLPPTKTVALVEYSVPIEAKSAFSHLAFKNFKGKPLMLEKAPVDVFKESLPVRKDTDKTKDDIVPEEEDMSETCTVFVKNLSFETSDDAFTNVFSALDDFKSAKISKKKNVKTGKMVSMGFGFVEFKSKEAAKNVIKTMQNYHLDGHALQLKLSDKSNSKFTASSGKEIKAAGTKLLVKNVPFEATKKDILELFGTFGQLKRVRLPKKFDGKTHRGFAFVDFLSKQEAKNAFESLASTHLYGRHLVIEWAAEKESLETLRGKTRKMYETLVESEGKRARVKLDGSVDEEADF